MTWQGWLTLALTLSSIGAMVAGLGADLAVLGSTTVLLATGVLTPKEAFAGFSNEGMLTVAALFVVAAALRETGGLDAIIRSALGMPRSVVAAQARMMFPVAAVSAFVNNTPIVALMVPIVADWARRTGIAASKLMLPLSYATILGGMCTLIGTSTNLVVSGLAANLPEPIPFSLLDPAPLGLPAVAAGLAYILIASRWLLPSRQADEGAAGTAREYMVAIRVEPGSPVVGKSVASAGLRHLPGLFLVEIYREGEVLPAVSPEAVLAGGDQLLFAGVVESVVDLLKIRGLVPATDQLDKLLAPRPDRRLVEAVVSARSSLAGMSIRETQFRTKYDAAVVAVHRGGERLRSKVGDIVLRPGDMLLLEAHPSFERVNRNDRDFALFHQVAHSAAPRYDRAWIALAVAAVMIALGATEKVPLVTGAFVAVLLLLLTRCLTPEDAIKAVEGRVLLAIAAAFSLGTALQKTGVAGSFGHTLVHVTAPLGAVGVVGGVYLGTALLTEVITHNAAASLMFPLVVATARAAHMPPKPLLIVMMVAASASFSTPIGYQTNLMVYGAGRYRFTDFLRFGIPLQVIVAVITTTTATLLWFR